MFRVWGNYCEGAFGGSNVSHFFWCFYCWIWIVKFLIGLKRLLRFLFRCKFVIKIVSMLVMLNYIHHMFYFSHNKSKNFVFKLAAVSKKHNDVTVVIGPKNIFELKDNKLHKNSKHKCGTDYSKIFYEGYKNFFP